MKLNQGILQVTDDFIVQDKYLGLESWVKQLKLNSKLDSFHPIV